MTHIEQPEWERDFLDNLYEQKRVQQSVTGEYWSSTVGRTFSKLGTIEADVSGEFGRWEREDFRASQFARFVAKCVEFESVLDVGPGDFAALSFFSGLGKKCSACEFPDSPYFREESGDLAGTNIYWGDFNEVEIKERFDLVWASHVLEHQVNPGSFLRKLVSMVVEGGTLAIVVPPRKPYIVSGHINLFNPGLLVYRVILSGINCKEAKVFQYNGNICLLVKKQSIELPKLHYDFGDLSALSEFFPVEVPEGFNGDFMHVGMSQEELDYIWRRDS